MTDLDGAISRSYERLVAWCRGYVQPIGLDADDLVHVAYLRCVRRWNPARASKHDPAAYLRQAIRWAAADLSRRRALDVQKLSEMRPSRQLNGAGDTSTRLELAEAIAQLPPRQREICRRLIAGAAFEATRRHFGLSRGAFAVALCRAHAALRAQFGLSQTRTRKFSSGRPGAPR
jgi:RNA polymerase sigma factor (sigma-70 family)